MNYRFPFLLTVLVVCILLTGCIGGETGTPTASPSPTAEPPEYAVANQEDISYSNVVRIRVDIVIETAADDLTDDDLRRLGEAEVDRITSEQDVNAIAVFLYNDAADVGWTADVSIEWAPNGEWDQAESVETGDYHSHEFAIERLR